MKKTTLLYLLLPLLFTSCTKKEASTEKVNAVEEKPVIAWFGKIENVAVETEVSRRNFYIIFDGSGSMSGEKLVVAKKALKKFIKVIPKEANIGLFAFDNNGVSERAKLGSSRDFIIQQVDIIRAGGGTPLGESVERAYSKIKKQAGTQLGYGEYNLVIITDGRATDGDTLNDAVTMVLNTSPVIIHTIGFQIGTDHVLNQPGKILYKTANNLKELSQGLEKVLAETEDFTVIDFKAGKF